MGKHREVIEQMSQKIEWLTIREEKRDRNEARFREGGIPEADIGQHLNAIGGFLNEFGQRMAELDLSLVGMSDNTARHGKAIACLCEQHKKTSGTVDAVVRAIK